MNATDVILIVEDDPLIQRLIGYYLRSEGYAVHAAGCLREAREWLTAAAPALMVLDVGLPDGDGFTFTREVRRHSDIPIIMVTGKDQTVDKVAGLELGADDYLTKPFDERELLARIRSILRRPRGSVAPSSPTIGGIARFGEGWRLDLTRHELISPTNETVYLTSHEFRLLEALARCPNRVLSRDALMDEIAGRDWSPLDRSVDVLVAKLRKKIENNPAQPALIKTIRGEGYKFTTEVTSGPAP